MRHCGFTLVELAIVMTIIGLLIGGVLKGQELMQNARATATISQIRSYEAAVTIFRDSYANLPGDHPGALNRLPSCTLVSGCANGNGNNILGLPAPPWDAVDVVIANENTQFWKHLAAVDLISGINPTATVSNWGETHPTSRLNGGFFARHVIAGYTITGTIFLLRNRLDGTASAFNTLVPKHVALIDRKMDDGLASTGFVQAVSDNWDSGCGTPNAGQNGPTGYDEQESAPVCEMFYKLQ